MDRLLTVKDIQTRYSCGPDTARKYMRQMRHTESPLRVSTEALAAWEADRTRGGLEEMEAAAQMRARARMTRQAKKNNLIPLPDRFERKRAVK